MLGLGVHLDRRRFLGLSAAVGTLPWVAVACAAPDDGPDASAPGPSAATADDGGRPERIAYGDDPSQFGELRLPGGEGPHPVVVLVHGGFWRAEYDLSLMEDLAADVADRGWAAWNVEYRRVGQDGGGWPGTLADVAAAIDHLALVADRPASPLDLTRVAVVGHSAGGHLAAWSAVRAGLPGGAPGASPEVVPAAVVSQAGVVDLRQAAADGLGGGATQDLLGGGPDDEPDRYDLASPIERLPTGIPVRCVHGRQDDIVPIDQSRRYVDAATAAGDLAVLAPFAGDHFPVLDPSHVSWTDTVAWLRPHLQP